MKKTTKLTLTAMTMVAIGGLASCSGDLDPVNSPEDMELSQNEIFLNFEARNDILIEIDSKSAWQLDTIISADPADTASWLSTDVDGGEAGKDMTVSCTENNTSSTRKSYIRLKLESIYPEYRSISVTQTGKPNVKTQPITDITSGSITLNGEWNYKGHDSLVKKGGFSILKNDKEEKIYGELEEKSFSISYPVESGCEYEVKAFAEDSLGNVFYAENSEKISIVFSFGKPVLEGELRSATEAKEVFINLPYYFGDGKTYTISAESSIKGIVAGPEEIRLAPEGGIIRLEVTGTPETKGEAVFTIKGLPDSVTEPILVKADIKQGGKHQILYWETFGEGYEYAADKGVSIPTGCKDGEPITDIRFSRTGQPDAEYIKSKEMSIRVEKKEGCFNPVEGYLWASSGPFVNLKKRCSGELLIHHLNTAGAKNLKLEFCVMTPVTQEEIRCFYSNDKGKTWTGISWSIPETDADYVLAASTSEIVGSEDMSLKFSMVSNDAKAKRFDDLRIYGDYE